MTDNGSLEKGSRRSVFPQTRYEVLSITGASLSGIEYRVLSPFFTFVCAPCMVWYHGTNKIPTNEHLVIY